MWPWKRRRLEEPYLVDHRQVVEPTRPSALDVLNRRRAEFLARLAARGVHLPHTVERFPHVVDRLADAWDDPLLTIAVFNGLMIDYRGGRRGFPPEVVREISKAFDAYRASLPRPRTCSWDEAV